MWLSIVWTFFIIIIIIIISLSNNNFTFPFVFFFPLIDLHPEFRMVPVATRGILGEPARLECHPPRGHPEAQVSWRKNGHPIDSRRESHSGRSVPGSTGSILKQFVLIELSFFADWFQLLIFTRYDNSIGDLFQLISR